MDAKWPHHPRIYQINTIPWLVELGNKNSQINTLSDLTDAMIPSEIQYFDAVWLLGVWKRSPRGIEISRNNKPLHDECRRILPDLQTEDLIGSAFSIFGYEVNPRIGGPEGIIHFRKLLQTFNIKLILDFIPNHFGIDAPIAQQHPDWFIQGNHEELSNASESFVQAGRYIFAHARDPYFPPWIDTIQINAFSKGLRSEYAKILLQIAELCDGVRCDMAMLQINAVFEKIWGPKVGFAPPTEFWTDIIIPVKTKFPHFLFMAEVYWDKEVQLHHLGFDYCYDKTFYDKLLVGSAKIIRQYLQADGKYQERLVRFIENHDEPRSLGQFGLNRAKVAAFLTLMVPGAKIIHEGQLQGMILRTPVQLQRRQEEAKIAEIEVFYNKFLDFLKRITFENSKWELITIRDPNNPISDFPRQPVEQIKEEDTSNAIAMLWKSTKDYYFSIVNYATKETQAVFNLESQLDLNKGNYVNVGDWKLTLETGNVHNTFRNYKITLKPWEIVLIHGLNVQ